MAKEVDVVSENANWTTRVEKELMAEGRWFDDGWGEIYGRGIPRDATAKIAQVEAELKRMEEKVGRNWKTTSAVSQGRAGRRLEVFGNSKHARSTAKDLWIADPYY